MIELNKIYNQDCLEGMKLLPDGSVDLVVTSPPYNMRTRIRNGKYTAREKTEHFSKKYSDFGDDLPIEEFYFFHKKCITEMLRVSKVVAYNFQIVTGSKEAFFRLMGDFSNFIKDVIIWDKGFGQPAMHEKVLNSAYELILILEKDEKLGRVIQNAAFKRGEMQNILRIKRVNSKIKGHSAVFPEELAQELITNFSKENGVVLDPFMGSGTTAISCINTNRNFIGFELEKTYCDLANDRIERLLK